MNEPLQKQRGVRFSAGAHDDDACAAVLLSIAECRTLRPVSVEVLPFLCSFAHRLRHTFDGWQRRSEEHTSELQSHSDLVCRLLLEKKKTKLNTPFIYTHLTTSRNTSVH